MDNTTRTGEYHWVQWLALGIGAVYTLVGLAGFAVTGLENFASNTDKTLLGFELNPLHNIVHLVIGLAGLAMWRRFDTARTYGWALAVGYGAVFVYGLVAVGNDDPNILSLNTADNGLHLGTALVGLVMALAPAAATRRTSGTTAGRTTTRG